MPSTGRNERPVIAVAAGCLINSRGEVLICQRPPGKIAAGKWEFPGGKIEPGETPRQALARELHEELGLHVREARPLIRVTHDYRDRQVVLDTWRITNWDGEPQSKDGQDFCWAAPERLGEWDLLAADRPIVAALRLPLHYVFTPPTFREGDVMKELARIPGGALLRLRLPELDELAYERCARGVIEASRSLRLGVVLDREPEQVQMLGAVGWHASAARLQTLQQRPLPHGFWFLTSCHSGKEVAMARALDVDAAVAGPVATTASHPGQSGIGWASFQNLADALSRPVYAIGGLGAADLDKAWQYGAQGVAGIQAYWDGGASGTTMGSSVETR